MAGMGEEHRTHRLDPVAVASVINATRNEDPCGSLDSGRGTPIAIVDTLEISSAYSTKTSGVDTLSQLSLEEESIPLDCSDLIDGRGKCPIDAPVNLAFRDLSYTVQTRVRLRRVPRRILHGVSGEFRAGQLIGIMGPSGAGKSSLMDVLSGYTSRGVSGSLLVNDCPRDLRHFRRQTVYLQQDASLHQELTVAESIHVAAALKLGQTGSQADERIHRVLESLGLLEHKNTMTARLSGGQLKRLAIALELLSDPAVMFFDEPTSGLDSSSTKQCVTVLQRLAREGRTVICTIHQPSASVFALLDQLYLLVNGRCAYRGTTASLVTYLGHLGLQCPPYHNPADYVMEIAGGEYGDHTDKLVAASGNGRHEEWSWIEDSNTRTGLLMRSTSATSSTSNAKVRGCCGHSLTKGAMYPTTFWMQLYILLKRTMRKGLRDKVLAHSRLYTHLITGLVIGTLFLDIGDDAAHIFHNFSLIFFCLMFLMFTALSAMIMSFPLEMPIVAREHFNRWYSLKSYFLAVTLADVPLQLMCILCYTIVVYFMTSQPMQTSRFFLFINMCAMVSFVAQSAGLLIGAGMKVSHGVIFGPLAILPFTIFSGYFVLQKDAPRSMRWLFDSSYMKYALDGAMLAVYGYGRDQLGCSEDYCHFRHPEKFLSEVDLAGGSYWWDVAVLVAMGLVLRVGAFYTLKTRLKYFR